ncbi:hypothetical protein ADICYQ_2257 [Cyclobacterium qasimii M12-11B]|uniref:Carbohydrate-binding domain-containing protein n=1 Tax=Cyclobacterium qasimii M12-11B TaxID=641524 RepID=S7VFT3_9BACT|nr:hypothetical protein ADICYQ_2257 [Cyclobacterium qasimii M12-11B]
MLLSSCSKSIQPRLVIPFSENEITLDGQIDSQEWGQAAYIEHLIAPWENNSTDKTEFKAFVSDHYFNFSFQVSDLTLVTIPFEKELSVAAGDRVELFFSNNKTLKKYYCVEMDPNGNVLDYAAKFYRDFSEAWDFESIKVATKITEAGYVLEGRIALEELKELGISNPFYLGIFRADFKKPHGKAVSWYSWINPNNPTPDFHISSAFGEAEFIEKTK